ncbi:MAG: hypothetical protein ACLTER_12905 [Ruminococcus sp.]
MGNEVTEKLVLFLQNLRCEDAGRETLVQLAGSKREKENLRDIRTGYEKLKERMPVSDKDYLEKYMEQAERVAFEGTAGSVSAGRSLLDAFQILCKG